MVQIKDVLKKNNELSVFLNNTFTVIPIKTFQLFRVVYTKNVYTEQKYSTILSSSNQLEYFYDPKKVTLSRNFLLFLIWIYMLL